MKHSELRHQPRHVNPIIQVGWECIKSIENVRARIEIFYADGMVVGMTESKPILSANSNQIGTTKVKINLSNLAPGTYYMQFSLFALNLRSREIIPRSWYKLLAIIFASP